MKKLSKRQKEILHWQAEGASNRQIAEHLGIEERSVKFYNTRMYKKMGVVSRVQAVVKAWKDGIVW